MMKRHSNNLGSDNTINNSDITQQVADTINNQTIIKVSQMPITKKSSIIQEVIEGILDLNIDLHPIELDTADYTIHDKIDHNKIEAYKVAFDLFMQESYLIEQRLRFLDSNKSATSSQRLYHFVKRVYMKYCGQADPDTRILCICNEIKNDLNEYPNISNEDEALVPIVVFYVFSKCHIFEKPPIPI